MSLSPEEQVRELARMVDIPIADEDVPEVATRLQALLRALEPLKNLDLEQAEPFPVLPEEAQDEG